MKMRPIEATDVASRTPPANYDHLYSEALRTVDEAQQAEIVHEMMKLDWDYGGYIIPVFNPVIVAQTPSLMGVTDEQRTADPWIEWQFRSLWFE